MFKVDLPYKDKDVVYDSDFWPDNIGCRPFFQKRRVNQIGDDGTENKRNHGADVKDSNS